MAALITSNFNMPEEYVAGVFKKAQTSSVLARLSGAKPQKFGKGNVMTLTSAPKAEIVAEGAQKSPTPTAYSSKTVTPVKLQVTVRTSNEVMWADEDYQLGVMADVQENCAVALGRALTDIVGIHKANPLTGAAAASVTEGLADTASAAQLSGTKYDEAVEAAAGLVIAAGYAPTGIALDPTLSFGLATMRDTTGRRIYPELGYGTGLANFEGMAAAVGDTRLRQGAGEGVRHHRHRRPVRRLPLGRPARDRRARHRVRRPRRPRRPPAHEPGRHPRRDRLRHRHHGPRRLRKGHQGGGLAHGRVHLPAERVPRLQRRPARRTSLRARRGQEGAPPRPAPQGRGAQGRPRAPGRGAQEGVTMVPAPTIRGHRALLALGGRLREGARRADARRRGALARRAGREVRQGPRGTAPASHPDVMRFLSCNLVRRACGELDPTGAEAQWSVLTEPTAQAFTPAVVRGDFYLTKWERGLIGAGCGRAGFSPGADG